MHNQAYQIIIQAGGLMGLLRVTATMCGKPGPALMDAVDSQLTVFAELVAKESAGELVAVHRIAEAESSMAIPGTD